jgi:protein TonB
MRDGLEILGTSALVSVFALFLIPMPERPGEAGAGTEGNDAVSVRAASASVEAMVERWERPPDPPASVENAALLPPSGPASPVAPSAPAPTETRVTPLPIPERSTVPERSAPPALDTSAPAPPPPRFAPEASPRPPARPSPQPQRRAEQPSQASASRAQQQAAGTGGGATQGQTRPREQASASPSERATLMSRWGGQIQARIARRAPRSAGKGTAVVTIRVTSQGALVGVGLARSSGNPQIDRLAVQAVHAAGGFPPAPAALGAGPFSFSLPIASR